jgi:hypothetical protein
MGQKQTEQKDEMIIIEDRIDKAIKSLKANNKVPKTKQKLLHQQVKEEGQNQP